MRTFIKRFLPAFMRGVKEPAYKYSELLKKYDLEVKMLSERLSKLSGLSFERYEDIFENTYMENVKKELVIGQEEYLKTHKKRFYELFNALLILNKKASPMILEFGVSEFSRLYKRILPQCRLYTADRPVEDDFPGFTEKRCMSVSSCERHFSIDLKKELPHEKIGLRGFDFVIFTELLEHLVANPVRLIRSLLILLSEEGFLYMSAPNFFKYENLKKMERRENPIDPYPGDEENWDCHYYFREYSMNELLEYVEKTGGRVVAFYFSHCVDKEELLSYLKDHEDEKGTLIVVANKDIRWRSSIAYPVATHNEHLHIPSFFQYLGKGPHEDA